MPVASSQVEASSIPPPPCAEGTDTAPLEVEVSPAALAASSEALVELGSVARYMARSTLSFKTAVMLVGVGCRLGIFQSCRLARLEPSVMDCIITRVLVVSTRHVFDWLP